MSSDYITINTNIIKLIKKTSYQDFSYSLKISKGSRTINMQQIEEKDSSYQKDYR
jgi:hypothetical protein